MDVLVKPARATLVIGYDGSPLALAAVIWAVSHAAPGESLVVATAVPPPPSQIDDGLQQLLRGDHARAAAENLAELGDVPQLRGCSWTSEVVEGGGPADALVETAVRHGAAAIVVGSHGYGPVSSILGSVSQRLLRISPVPVVVVPLSSLPKTEWHPEEAAFAV
jgi:nucleotide-binding universal stress UspA family protein